MSDAGEVEKNPISPSAEHTPMTLDAEQQAAGVGTSSEINHIREIATELADTGLKPAAAAVPPETNHSGLSTFPKKDIKPVDSEWSEQEFQEFEQKKVEEGLKNAA